VHPPDASAPPAGTRPPPPPRILDIPPPSARVRTLRATRRAHGTKLRTLAEATTSLSTCENAPHPTGCSHGISVDLHRIARRPRHHHVRTGPLAPPGRLRPRGEASEGRRDRARVPAGAAAGAVPRPRDSLPAAARARGRHDAAGRLARRHHGQPLQPPVPRGCRPQHL